MFFDNSKYFIFDREIRSSQGDIIKIFKLANDLVDEKSLDMWASSLKNNYCEECFLNSLISGTGLTRKEYLENFVFPDPSNPQGAATMSGEFGEILMYDFIYFVLKYYITRTRYLEKVNRNMPVPGSDVIGYKLDDINNPNYNDQLIVAEVKTSSRRLAQNEVKDRIELAIKHSVKDKLRIGESLNAEKRRLLNRSRNNEAKIVERFQNKTDRPFKMKLFAVIVLEEKSYSDEAVLDAVNNQHEKSKETNILIICSKELKTFLRELYRRACLC